MVQGERNRPTGQRSWAAFVICLFLIVAAWPVGAMGATAQGSAACDLSRTQIQPGEEVTLDASASENATAYRYAPDEDASFGPWRDTPQYQFVYDEAGTYHPRVQIQDTDGTTATTSCGTLNVGNRAPTVNISFFPAEPMAGEAVTFTSKSSDPDGEVVAYTWRIDGQVISEERRIEYTFDDPGDHTVEVTVEDDDGATASDEVTVTVQAVNEPPTVTLSVTPSEPAPGEPVTATATASDSDGNITGYEWWVDGERIVFSPDAEFSYNFDEVGEHTIRVVTEDDDGATAEASTVVTVQAVNEPPTAEINYSPTEPAPGTVVTFEAAAGDPDGSITGYEWRVDGDIVSSRPATEYSFSEPGSHRVSLRVADDDGASVTVNTTVSVAAPTSTPAELSATADWWYTPMTPRAGERVSLVAEGEPNASLTYEWDVDGDGSVDRTGVTVGYRFSKSGTYNVTLTVVGPTGARNTETRRVRVQEGYDVQAAKPDPPFVMVPRRPRPGEAVTLIANQPPGPGTITAFEWDLDGDGETEKRGATVTVRFPETNRTVVTLATTYRNGTVHRQSSAVSTNGPPVVNGTNRPGPWLWTIPANPRPGQNVTLVADPAAPTDEIAAYRWDFDGDNVTDKQGATVVYSFASDGHVRINLTLERSNGTVATVDRVIPVGDVERPRNTATPPSDTRRLLPDIGLLGLLGGIAVAGLLVALLAVGWRRTNT